MLRNIVNYAWRLTAALVISAAAVVAVGRVMLPHVHEQRDAVESWLSGVVGRPVNIGEITAHWQGWAPAISVTNIALLAENGADELIRFDRATVDIAPLKSLFARSPVPENLVLRGVGLTLVRNADGSFAVAGMPPSKWPIAEWLLNQRSFSVTDTDITYIDNANQSAPVAIDNISLWIRNNGNQHQVLGLVDLPAAMGKRLLFRLDAAGDLLNSDWRGDIYLEAHEASLRDMIWRLGWRGNEIAHGDFEMQAWTHWEEGRLLTVKTRLSGKDFRVQDNDAATIEKFAADASLTRVDAGWSLLVDRLNVSTPATAWPETTLSARWRSATRGATTLVFDVGFLELAQVLPIIEGFAPVSDEWVARVAAVSPSGRLHDVRAGFVAQAGAQPTFYFDGQFDALTLKKSGKLPEITGLDGRLTMNAHAGAILLDGTDFMLNMRGGSSHAVPVRDLSGRVRWEELDSAWTIDLGDLGGVIDGSALRALGRLELGRGVSPSVGLAVTIDGGSVANVHELFPQGALPKKGQRWLDDAFKSGRIETGALVIRGDLSAFPFDQGEGTFQAQVDLSGVDLQYARAWPHANELSARLTLNERVFSAAVAGGKIFDARIKHADVTMQDLFTKDRVVRVSGSAHATPQDTIRFVTDSPLKKSKAARIAGLEIDGEIDLDLDINIPLRRRHETEVLGQVHFGGNHFYSKVSGVTLDKVAGSVSFTRKDWYGEGLQAEYDGERVGLIVNGGLDDPNYDSEFRMTGTSDAPHLLGHLRRFAPPVYAWLTANKQTQILSGRLPWKAVLTIPEPSLKGRTVPKRLILSSSLSGLDVDLPRPFGKSAAERRSIQIETLVTDKKLERARVEYGGMMTADLVFDEISGGTRGITAADIALGADKPDPNVRPGISIHGDIDVLALNDWAAFLQNTPKSATTAIATLPVAFDVGIGQLDVLGQQVDAARLSGSRNATDWNVKVASTAVAGAFEIPVDGAAKGLDLRFERIWLSKLDSGQKRHLIDPSQLPALSLNCESFRYGDVDLGRAALTTRPAKGGLHLESLNFHNEHVTVQAKGDWLVDGDAHQSLFDIDVHGDGLGNLLANFGYEITAIEGGASNIEIEARWAGMPSDFTLELLNGTLRLKVSEGRFLDIEQGSGGRLFGLLSLQTLPRRLSLDFEDLFNKGLTFDSIEGSFVLDGGNAYTNSLMMDGPSARIDISGRTGLAEHDYDQQVIVIPALSNTIPLASALFGPAGIGVGAVIYLGQKMFKSIPREVDRLLSRQYSITGKWDNPVIERL